MISSPVHQLPTVWIADDVRSGRHVLPAGPIRPALPEIARVPRHVCSVRLVRERVLAVRVVRVGKNYNVVGKAPLRKSRRSVTCHSSQAPCFRKKERARLTYPGERSAVASAGWD